ncbi:hypothetical protein LOD99_7972 [Oopsacas minuta]|uniref:Uncharacterized protein n=1 Tax=Oopsacas minuta TaxID=111878 RepID=A0AAV7JIA6_9METZ|nr:hypothetical protein LOD99_7972 [Oopsacas minuta]
MFYLGAATTSRPLSTSIGSCTVRNEEEVRRELAERRFGTLAWIERERESNGSYEGNGVKRTNEHLHVPDVQTTGCCEIKAGIKRKTRDTQDSSHHIIGEGMLTASEGTTGKLPKLDSLKRTIQRQRASVLSVLVEPTALSELVLPAEYQWTAKGEQFLLYDSGEDDAYRFPIFGPQRNLGVLQQSKIWLADGTFKTVPPLFAQVYVVHGLRGGNDPMKTGHLLPSLFVLLPNKTEDTYRRMWEQIRLLCPLALDAPGL